MRGSLDPGLPDCSNSLTVIFESLKNVYCLRLSIDNTV